MVIDAAKGFDRFNLLFILFNINLFNSCFNITELKWIE
jgi:hypothetical protein